MASLINADCSNLKSFYNNVVLVVLLVVVCVGVIFGVFKLMVAANIFCCFSWLLMISFVIWFVWSNITSCNMPFLVESPICRVEGTLDGGQMRRVAMSDAACVRKLSVVMVEIGIVCEMKTSISVTISVVVKRL